MKNSIKLTTKGEKLVYSIFTDSFNLKLEKIKTIDKSQPDFNVLFGDNKIAVCEVKDIEPIIPSKESGWTLDELGVWSRPDNSAPRIRTKIHEAYQQLKQYDSPRILVFVNFDSMVNIGDLQQAINGYLPYRSKSHPEQITNIHDPFKESLCRIVLEMNKIDLYIWIDYKTQNPNIYFRMMKENEAVGKEIYEQYFKPKNEARA